MTSEWFRRLPVRFVLGCIATLLVDSGKAEENFEIDVQVGHKAAVTAVLLLQKEGLVVTGGMDRSIAIWNAQTGEVLRRIGVAEHVLWFYREDNSSRLWVISKNRYDIAVPQCFDLWTGDEYDEEIARDMGTPDSASNAINRGVWKKLKTLVRGNVGEYFVFSGGALAILRFNGKDELWDVKNGRRLQINRSFSGYARDRPKLGEGAGKTEEQVWNHLKKYIGRDATSGFLSADNQYCVVGFEDGRGELWQVKDPHRIQTFRTRIAPIHGVACNADGTLLASWNYVLGRAQTGGESHVIDLRFWDFKAMQMQRSELADEGIVSACMTKSGDFLYAVLVTGPRYRVVEIDARSGRIIRDIKTELDGPASLRLSEDDSLLGISEIDSSNAARLFLWDRRSNSTKVRKFSWAQRDAPESWGPPGSEEPGRQIRACFSWDNTKVLIGDWERPTLYDVRSGHRLLTITDKALKDGQKHSKTLTDLPKQDKEYELTGFLADLDIDKTGEWIAYGTTHRGLGGHEVVNLKTHKRWIGDVPGLHHIRFRPNSPQVIVAGCDTTETIEVRNVKSGAILGSWVEEQGEADRAEYSDNTGWDELMDSLALTADGNRLFFAKSDGAIRMLQINPEGKLTAALELVALAGTDWCAISPEGFYTGSPAGIGAIRLTAKRLTLSLSQLDPKYNRPDIIAETVGVDATRVAVFRELVRTREAEFSPLNPGTPSDELNTITFRNVSNLPIETTNETFSCELELPVAEGRPKQLQLLANGVVLRAESETITNAVQSNTQVVPSIEVPLRHGINRIQVTGINARGSALWGPVLQVDRTGSRQRNVRALCVGVSKYSDSGYDLSYAADDAVSVRDLVSKWGDPNAIVDVRLLTDSQATRGAIIKTAEELFGSADPDDLLAIFIAGHGAIGSSQHGEWYFCPFDHDFKNNASRGISFAELTALINKSRAYQRLLLIDSCGAGGDESISASDVQALSEKGVATRLVRASRTAGPSDILPAGFQTIRLQDLFADFRTTIGSAVIGASSAFEFARESSRVKHGIFTDALLRGVAGRAADFNRDGNITASELHRFLAREVANVTLGYQHPSTRGINPENDFVVVRTK